MNMADKYGSMSFRVVFPRLTENPGSTTEQWGSGTVGTGIVAVAIMLQHWRWMSPSPILSRIFVQMQGWIFMVKPCREFSTEWVPMMAGQPAGIFALDLPMVTRCEQKKVKKGKFRTLSWSRKFGESLQLT